MQRPAGDGSMELSHDGYRKRGEDQNNGFRGFVEVMAMKSSEFGRSEQRVLLKMPEAGAKLHFLGVYNIP